MYSLATSNNFYTSTNNLPGNTTALNNYNLQYDNVGLGRVALPIAPVITSISPTTLRAGFDDVITITGSGFDTIPLGTCGSTSGSSRLSITTTALALYPNPANTELILQIPYSETVQNQSIQILTNAGQVLQSIKVYAPQETINTQHLPNGMYLLQYYDGNATHTQKFIIQH